MDRPTSTFVDLRAVARGRSDLVHRKVWLRVGGALLRRRRLILRGVFVGKQGPLGGRAVQGRPGPNDCEGC